MMQPKPRKAISYVRVSTRPQEATASRETQLARNESYALREGLTIVHSAEDVGSGLSIKERPNFVREVDRACDPSNGITDFIFDDPVPVHQVAKRLLPLHGPPGSGRDNPALGP